MESLPPEILLEIFEKLRGIDLEMCFYVCRKWAWLIRNTQSVWSGNQRQKAIGQGPFRSLFLRHLKVFPHIKYVDFSEPAFFTMFDAKTLLDRLRCGKVERICLRDPNVLTPFLQFFQTLPSLVEFHVHLYKMHQREARLAELKKIFPHAPLDRYCKFTNHMYLVWQRSTNHTHLRCESHNATVYICSNSLRAVRFYD